MPLPSEVDTTIRFVSVSTRVTVAPETTAPWGSVTVPRREARNCAWASGTRRIEEKIRKVIRREKLEQFIWRSLKKRHGFGAIGHTTRVSTKSLYLLKNGFYHRTNVSVSVKTNVHIGRGEIGRGEETS